MSKRFFRDLFKNKEAKILEQERLTEQRLEEARLVEEKRLEEERLAEAKRLVEEQKLAEERKRIEEKQRLAEEKKRIEKEQRLAEEKRINDEEKNKRGQFIETINLKNYRIGDCQLELFENFMNIINRDEVSIHKYFNNEDKPSVMFLTYPEYVNQILMIFVKGDIAIDISAEEFLKNVDFVGSFPDSKYQDIKSIVINFYKQTTEVLKFAKNLNQEILIYFKNFIENKSKDIFLNKELIEYVERKHIDNLLTNDNEINGTLFIDMNSLFSYENKDLERFPTFDETILLKVLTNVRNLHNLLIKKKYLTKKSPIFTWGLLRYYSIQYYSEISKSMFNNLFNDLNNLSTLQEYIEKYFSTDELEFDPLKNLNITSFTYYLMRYHQFHELNSFDIIVSVNKMKELILMEFKKKKDIEFEQSLLNPQKCNSNAKISINDIDLLSGYDFEEFVSELFTRLGYTTKVTSKSGDQGIDLIAEKRGRKFGIQTKCFSNKVTNTAIQEVVAGITHYNCNKGIVVTNNFFTKSAIELARSNSVILWDRNTLIEKINDIETDSNSNKTGNSIPENDFNSITQAAYNILTILSIVDNDFNVKEQEVIQKFLKDQNDTEFSIEIESEAIIASINDLEPRFRNALIYYQKNSTAEEKQCIFEYAVDTISADKDISEEEIYYIDMMEKMLKLNFNSTFTRRFVKNFSKD